MKLKNLDHGSSLRLPLCLVATTVVAGLGAGTPVLADEVDQCIAGLQAAYEQPQQFSQEGEITCPAAETVGSPPKIRRNNRSGSITFTAPPGSVVQNSITVLNMSQSNGQYGAPSISTDGRTVTVPIACYGGDPGEGRSWQRIRISGVTVQVPTQEMLRSWVLQCVRCVAEKHCPQT
jgi:hypothetical protein